MRLYSIQKPTAPEVPIIISIPHAGTKFPAGMKSRLDARLSLYLDDTDWYVDRLYDFAPSLGITVIKANLSRWVVDLNRDARNIPLYNDGRTITSVVPTSDFFGNQMYKSKLLEPSPSEIAERIQQYYKPYYVKVESLIHQKLNKFKNVLLWDGHSIRHKISTIHPTVFPDVILGSNDRQSANNKLIDTALEILRSSDYTIAHNSPFKGGNITRSFGKPQSNVHALQLEMNKILYMDDNEIHFNADRALKVKAVLKQVLVRLAQTINEI